MERPRCRFRPDRSRVPASDRRAPKSVSPHSMVGERRPRCADDGSESARVSRHDRGMADRDASRHESKEVQDAPAHDRKHEGAARAPAAPLVHAPVLRRNFSSHNPRVLVIGSSTGGPQALMALVTDLGPVIDRFPVLITQHMPPTFTTILAEHLARSSRKPAHEAIDGEIGNPQCHAPRKRGIQQLATAVDVDAAIRDGRQNVGG